MRAGSFFESLLAILVLVVSGCNQLVSVPVGSPSAVRPLIFYDETGRPSEDTPVLSNVELDRVIDEIAVRTITSIWFIRVKLHAGDSRSVVVHMAPDRQTPRIREGIAYDVWANGQETHVYAPWQYLQISGTGQTFTGRLALPSVIDLPFRTPLVNDPNIQEGSAIPEEELIRISEFVRRRSSYKGLARRNTPPAKMKAIVEEFLKSPILHISDMGDAKIQVQFGYLHGPMWGHGVELELQRTWSGYCIIGWGQWWS